MHTSWQLLKVILTEDGVVGRMALKDIEGCVFFIFSMFFQFVGPSECRPSVPWFVAGAAALPRARAEVEGPEVLRFKQCSIMFYYSKGRLKHDWTRIGHCFAP